MYSAYQKIDEENLDIVFAGCYVHCRRKFSDVLKGLKGKQKENAPADCETTGRGLLCVGKTDGGKQQYQFRNDIEGAKASAIIYNITEIAKANVLNPFQYMEYLLTELMEHLDDTDRSSIKSDRLLFFRL